MNTTEITAKYADEMIALRRQIHEHPELSNREFETTALIREKLTEYGIEIAGIGLKTGVVGILRGGFPGKTVAIREDIDALPMEEQTGLPFASKNPGVCHSCGHDIHTSVLLYCARVLAEIREELHGNVMFLFQPAEETGTGAKQLIECRFMDVLKPDVFIGLHTGTAFPVGTIGVKKGPAGGSSDTFHIIVTGKGGHGAHPENFVDPIMVSAFILTQLQTIVARENYPMNPGVLTVGTIQGGTAANIVPDSVRMSGTIRALDTKTRKSMQDSIDRIVKSCSEALRAKGEVQWDYGMPPLVNSDEVVDQLIASAEKIIGRDHITMIANPSMGSEDFSCLFPEYAPGAQFSLGTRDPENPETKHGIHNGKNVFDDRCIPTGAAVLVQFTRDFLSKSEL